EGNCYPHLCGISESTFEVAIARKRIDEALVGSIIVGCELGLFGSGDMIRHGQPLVFSLFHGPPRMNKQRSRSAYRQMPRPTNGGPLVQYLQNPRHWATTEATNHPGWPEGSDVHRAIASSLFDLPKTRQTEIKRSDRMFLLLCTLKRA